MNKTIFKEIPWSFEVDCPHCGEEVNIANDDETIDLKLGYKRKAEALFNKKNKCVNCGEGFVLRKVDCA